MLISCIMLFAGCQGSAPSVELSEITGTWVREHSDMKTTYTFNSDYTYEENSSTTSGIIISVDASGTFELKGDEIILHEESSDYEYSYKISIDGTTMYWNTDSAQLEYKKQ